MSHAETSNYARTFDFRCQAARPPASKLSWRACNFKFQSELLGALETRERVFQEITGGDHGVRNMNVGYQFGGVVEDERWSKG